MPTTRRVLLLSSLAALARGDTAQQIRDLFGDMANALTACNPQAFLAAFDKTMPGYHELTQNVTALVNEYVVESVIDLNKDDGDDQKRTVEADWLLTLRPRETQNCENPRPVTAHPVRRNASCRPQPLRPLHNTRYAHPKQRCRRTARPPATHRRHNTFS